jgi:hypothetical protein
VSSHTQIISWIRSRPFVQSLPLYSPSLTKLWQCICRNPWGQRSDSGYGVWHGPWSDGSKEWTPEILKKIRHEFADNGAFWMSFEDMLSNFKWIHRTRLFDERWTVAQQWTSSPVSWVPGFLKSRFVVEIKQEGMVVFVLSTVSVFRVATFSPSTLAKY